MELGVASAIISFNDGGLNLLPVFSKCKIKRGQFRMTYLWKKDASRMKIMEKKCSDSNENRRSNLRSIRKKIVIDSETKEGEIYGKGRFHIYYCSLLF